MHVAVLGAVAYILELIASVLSIKMDEVSSERVLLIDTTHGKIGK